jgi:hypothetical protein
MSNSMVKLINSLSEVYSSIRERVVNTGEMLESDVMFIKFYDKFINDVFDVEKRRKMLND